MTAEPRISYPMLHRRDMFLRGGASIAMWLFALISYVLGIIKSGHFILISASVLFLVVLGLPAVALSRRIARPRTHSVLAIFVNAAEVAGYTAIIYSLGADHASYLTLLYAVLVTYVGVVEHRGSPYVTAVISGVFFYLVLVLVNFGVLPRQEVHASLELPWPNQIMISLVVTALLNVAAYISSYAAHQIKSMKQELVEQNALLEQRVGLRTAELENEIEERKQAERRIMSALREKEVLLKEVHHRVKNNLQVISSLLSLQSDFSEDPASISMFQESRLRVRSMALLHERLYQSESLDRIDFASYLRNLLSDIYRSHQIDPEVVTYVVDADDFSLDIDRAVPCGLIINELFTNALKHAFPDGRRGMISIEARVIEGADPDQPGEDENCRALRLGIHDDGVGIPDGFHIDSSGTLGMQLVAGLAKQLGATVELLSGEGTTFVMAFPLDPDA